MTMALDRGLATSLATGVIGRNISVPQVPLALKKFIKWTREVLLKRKVDVLVLTIGSFLYWTFMQQNVITSFNFVKLYQNYLA